MEETYARLAKAVSDAACRVGPTRAGLVGHDVQFCRNDAQLTEAVALWADGTVEGAMCLEEHWNELADQDKYSPRCGYSVDHFLHEAGIEGVRRACEHHTRALPLEPLGERAN